MYKQIKFKYLSGKSFQVGTDNYIGFTLAEMLITLGIIGIIAAFTIPALINNTRKAESATKLIKEYSSFSQAFDLIIQDASGDILNNSNFSCTGNNAYCQTTPSANAVNYFVNKLNAVKNCGNGTGCLHDLPVYFLGGTKDELVFDPTLDTSLDGIGGKAILADGAMMIVLIYGGNCSTSLNATADNPLNNSVCGILWIDINGSKGPNTEGRDFLQFWITKTGLYPAGSLDDGYSCDTSSMIFDSSFGCTGKILEERAMNY